MTTTDMPPFLGRVYRRTDEILVEPSILAGQTGIKWAGLGAYVPDVDVTAVQTWECNYELHRDGVDYNANMYLITCKGRVMAQDIRVTRRDPKLQVPFNEAWLPEDELACLKDDLRELGIVGAGIVQ